MGYMLLQSNLLDIDSVTLVHTSLIFCTNGWSTKVRVPGFGSFSISPGFIRMSELITSRSAFFFLSLVLRKLYLRPLFCTTEICGSF